jgi:hypothetical protein
MEANEMSALPGDDCGCCAGAAASTTCLKFNPPGQPEVAYRVGTWRRFRDSTQARLSSTEFPALVALGTRDTSDWTVALLDAFSCVADVLSFYQERIANESWLRTAVERRSVHELAQLIGYQPAPGVAASTWLAFTLESAPGQPALAAVPVTLPVGTRVQSVPGPNENPQTFETVAALTARVEWNAIPAQRTAAEVFAAGQTSLQVAGTGLQAGDVILIVGGECTGTPVPGQRWAVRRIDAVQPDAARGSTHLTWSAALEGDWSQPASQGVAVWVFRQQAALFGSQAPWPGLLSPAAQEMPPGVSPDSKDWNNASRAADGISQALDLDAAYPRIVSGNWLALVDGPANLPDRVSLHRVTGTAVVSRAAYALAGRLSRLWVDADLSGSASFGLRTTSVFAQPEPLSLARRPLRAPVFGSTLVLGVPDRQLQPGQQIALTGKRQRVSVPSAQAALALADLGGALVRLVRPSESFMVMAAPGRSAGAGQWLPLSGEDLEGASPSRPGAAIARDAKSVPVIWRWTVWGPQGRLCTIDAGPGVLELQPALASDPLVAEAQSIAADAAAIVLDESAQTTALRLITPLVHCYDRATVSVNANVAPASHGETVTEIAGSGDASQPDQRFMLKQSPLTHVASATDPQGAASTLQVRVDDLLWQQRATLFGSGPNERVYSLRHDDDGKTTLQFGDGAQGARLPSALNNLRFQYRKGLGVSGNLRENQITTLLSRPLGLKSATNPVPAIGGQDAETLAGTRRNAPLRVRTMDRAVSVTDYADFAQAFAGIAKSSARWIDAGPARGIHLTVAGSNGDDIPDGSATQTDLLAALRRYGDPLLPLTVHSYLDARFTLTASVRVADDADPEKTLAAVQAALRTAFAFEPRDFGQAVTLDEVYAVIHSVASVVAADVHQFFRTEIGPSGPQPAARLLATWPSVQPDGSVSAAELLTLDAGALLIGVLS